ncbi:MAG: DUF2917 domain-containing protein [Casimicrobiaceae bacterium]
MHDGRYVKSLDMAEGNLLKLDDARGTTLRVARGTLWVTQERDRRDFVLGPGDVWAIERDGLTLVGAQTAAMISVVGAGAVDAHVCERRMRPLARLRHFLNQLAAA